ncbi:MAG: hypothetical protein HC906_06890, partial [Bacteroidales bacterium]|nr:hypothetical protein [Bacteroidales bacterium]
MVIKNLVSDSADYWERTADFETIKDSSILTEIVKQTLDAILARQNNNTGLFYTWLQDKSSYLYGQGLVLKILSNEGTWVNSKPDDKYAMAAEKLALFLAEH